MSSPPHAVRRRPTAVLATLAVTAGSAFVALPAAPAEASITTLCTGFTSCAAKGMGNAGYAAVYRSSFWRMYGGHNCTNYAAYRMIKAGMSSARPWTGGGNATNWGTKMSRITNGVPRVGAVAWWRAGTRPAGSSGHVGFVERVVSNDEVVVSMDSWGGDFSWVRITRSGGGWPSGFVHFRDVPLRAVKGASVSGVAKVGGVLRASTPTWSPAATRVTYQWYAGAAAIKGATGASYVPTQAQLGKALTVRVQGTRFGYPAAAGASAPTSAVLPGTMKPTVAPTLRGRPGLGRVLTATPGAWTPRPDSVRFRWLSGGRVIPGATRSTLVAGPSTVNRSIAVQVIASRRGFTDVVRTLGFRSVAPGDLGAVGRPTLAGSPRLGRTLRVQVPRVPKGVTARLQWVRAKDGVVLQNGGTTYRLGARDLGSRVVTRLTVSRYGYRTETTTSRTTGLVRTTPAMRVVTARSTKGLAATLTVRAAGVPQVGGLVKVRTASGRLVARIPVRAGEGRAVIRGLHGRSVLRFSYVQNRKVAGVSVKRLVRMPR